MDDTRPLISVIIPVFNEEKRIGQALDSIRNQTYKNLEIIVVDDWSTDNTAQVVKDMAAEDSRITYLALTHDDHQRTDWRGVNINAGYSARNFGMEKARGEWITFQDADDASMLNRIETQYRLAKEYGAMHVSLDWQQYKDELIGRMLDTDKILREEENVVVPPEVITALAKSTKGVLMASWFPHRLVPFFVKRLPVVRKLFFKSTASYPCAGNTPLFSRAVLEKVRFRRRNDRVWPALSGRGADRDFCFAVAETFGKSYAFRLPLYLWRVSAQNPEYASYGKYLL